MVQELHAKSHDIALMKGSSSRAIHKAETMGNAPRILSTVKQLASRR